jgi:nucleoside-diphosphate-sugar epimerase
MKIALIGAGSSVGRHLLSLDDERFIGIYRSDRALSQLCDLDLGPRLVKAAGHELLVAALRGCDAAVTLVNDLNPAAARDSLRQTLEACAAAGVGRLIHLGSAAIYGAYAHRVRSLDAAGPRLTWNSYAAGKQWQERYLKRHAGRLRSVVVLRPGLIWGPGMAWLHAPAGELLRHEAWIAEGDAPCNLANIHLLSHAIVELAKQAPDGLSFCNLFDRERLSWSAYYGRIAERLGLKDCAPQIVPRAAVPPWIAGVSTTRHLFPLALAWSVATPAVKTAVKATVRRLAKPAYTMPVSVKAMEPTKPSISREVWELKTARGMPPSGPLLEQLHQSYMSSPEQEWAEVERLRTWLWV